MTEVTGSDRSTDVGLTAGETARQLGVAVTTLRSWHRRYGLGPTRHVRGRHRRYGPDDLARLEVMRTLTGQGMPAADAARMAIAGVLVAESAVQPEPDPQWSERAARGLVRAAMRLDAGAVRWLVADALSRHGVVTTWEAIVVPALTRVGERHAATGALVEVEHLLSRCVSESLAAVARPPADTPARVLLACADEEQHSLPLEALAAALAERNLGCRLLGARTPPSALHAAVSRTGPALVVLWSHHASTAGPGQLQPLLGGSVHRPLAAVAGPGWGDNLPEGVLRPGRLADAVALATAADRAAPRPRGAVVP
jgi:MerR family transcriptional regulator, light-induced transcriptional regulator